jgi:gluconolactonase
MDVSEDIAVWDDEMLEVVLPGEGMERLVDGLRFTEGPVWVPAEQALLLSDVPADTIYRWSEADGLSVFRRPSNQANGNTLDGRGRLITCEHQARRVTRTAADGTVEVIATTYAGRRLNSPNDVVVRSDGSIWFTDPPYGVRPDQQEQPANFVFRLDPGGGEPTAVVSDFSRPNGLCFSPDEGYLYVADSDDDIHHVRRFRVTPEGTLTDDTVFADIRPGLPDGIRTDDAGRLYVTAGDGVQVFAPDGRKLGVLTTPKPAANCAFGAADGRTLFVTARDGLYAIDLRAGRTYAPTE